MLCLEFSPIWVRVLMQETIQLKFSWGQIKKYHPQIVGYKSGASNHGILKVLLKYAVDGGDPRLCLFLVKYLNGKACKCSEMAQICNISQLVMSQSAYRWREHLKITLKPSSLMYHFLAKLGLWTFCKWEICGVKEFHGVSNLFIFVLIIPTHLQPSCQAKAH